MPEVNWTNSAGGDWSDASDWSTDTVPTFSDDVLIVEGSPTVVTISGADEAATLTFNTAEGELVENAGSLSVVGELHVESGLVSLNEANAIGTITMDGGELAFGNSGGLGTGIVFFNGGELLATENESLTNEVVFKEAARIAAAHGTTLDEDASLWSIQANTTLDIGSPGDDGTIIWHTNAASTVSPATESVIVQAGTLKAADADFTDLFAGGVQTGVDVGATIDLAGFNADISDLLSSGVVTDSGGAATLTLDGGARFSGGAITGSLSVIFGANAALAGLEDYTGSATLEGTASVINSGTYNLVANTNVNGTSSTSFVNDNLFEKTGRGDVTTDFVNNDTLNVLSGSIEFSGGFTNNGVIHGLVFKSKLHPIGEPAEVTVSAAVPSDFNGDRASDILWQNADGQASIWEMEVNTLIGGGAVSPNPGSSWKAIGTGDFNGDGHADILWQNADGQASIWDMNGNTPIGGGPVSPNPGTSWKAIGTGDFNADGFSDILWRNTSGQVSIWEMDGNKLIGGGPVSPNPGLSWHAIGTDGGGSDILFQNTNGQTSIWDMSGTSLVGGGPVSPNPGPSWRAVGLA